MRDGIRHGDQLPAVDGMGRVVIESSRDPAHLQIPAAWALRAPVNELAARPAV
jgi:hypothetical protein